MSKREKRLLKIRQSQKDVSMQELRQLLEDFGFKYEPTDGSHYIFRYNNGGLNFKIPIPFHRPIKEYYVKQVIKLIDQIIAQEKHDE